MIHIDHERQKHDCQRLAGLIAQHRQGLRRAEIDVHAQQDKVDSYTDRINSAQNDEEFQRLFQEQFKQERQKILLQEARDRIRDRLGELERGYMVSGCQLLP